MPGHPWGTAPLNTRVWCCDTDTRVNTRPAHQLRWAIGMSHLRSTSHTLGDADFPYIYKKGPAFGMP